MYVLSGNLEIHNFRQFIEFIQFIAILANAWQPNGFCHFLILFFEEEDREQITAIENDNGMNALMWAAYEGHTNIVKILIPHFKEQHKLNVKANNGYSAIDCARMSNVDAIIELLEKAVNSV